jgi:TfoX/Sxy family transcriptional regulator of competence genes
MPYNLELEKSIDRLASKLGIDDKKKMFGGIGYLFKGKMAFGIHKEWLIVRTTPENADKLLKKEGVKVFDITGRPMKGWLMIDPTTLETVQVLVDLLNLGVDFIKDLGDQS